MQQFSGRERLGVAAAGAIVLFLGVGGLAFSRTNASAGAKPSIAASAFRPTSANGVPAALELAAGGDAATATTQTVSTAAATASIISGGGSAPIFVHVAGAVKSPGVYRFQNGDRINDAVKAAGGFQSSADRDALNLADTLQDADQIYIPTTDTAEKASAAGGAIAYPPPSTSKSRSKKSRSRRTHPLITPGTPVVQGHDQQIMPLPGPLQPGDITVQPLPLLPRDGAQKYPTLTTVAIAEPRRGRVIGRLTPANVPTDDGTTPDDSGDGSGADESAALVAPRVSGSHAGIKGSVSKKESAAKGGSAKSAKFKNPGDGVVHLNAATAEQLEKLPGVGPAMSGRIVEYRTEIGKFTDVSQLMDVKGIGDKKYAKMEPFLAL